MIKILIVEDEEKLARFVELELKHEGYEVIKATNGRIGLEIAEQGKVDLVLLDVMLPGLTGFEVCQAIREFSSVPIIMLTAKGEDMDKILGLEYGADDYITKPFNILEVKARIKAILRRSAHHDVKEEESAKVVECRGLKIDCESRRVHIHGKEVNLTAKEFDLLELLVFHPNKVYSREDLLNTVWGLSLIHI